MMCIRDFELALDNALKEMREQGLAIYCMVALKVDAEVGFACIEETSHVWNKRVKHASCITLAYDRLCSSLDGKEPLPKIPGCICNRLWIDVESDKSRVKLVKKIIGGLQTFLHWFQFVNFCFYYDKVCFCEYCVEYPRVKVYLDKHCYDGIKLWRTFSKNFYEVFMRKWIFCFMEDITSKKSRVYSRLKCIDALHLYDVVVTNFFKCNKICWEWNSVMNERL